MHNNTDHTVVSGLKVVRPVARLALEDGTIFTGRGFGALKCNDDRSPLSRTGEVVFNTAMTGYQESLTDPSYAGQILVMTTPMIGIYGINDEDYESAKVQVAGFVVRELSRTQSNYRAKADLDQYLAEEDIPGIEGINTRALTCRLRASGSMRGVISSDTSLSDDDLVALATSADSMQGCNLVTGVGATETATWDMGFGKWSAMHSDSDKGTDSNESSGSGLKVVAIDCGAKQSILRHLVDRGCEVITVPHNISLDSLLELSPDGLLISNGPGDPAAVVDTVDLLRMVINCDKNQIDELTDLPIFGICLGHQMLCLALGAKTYKMKFGHRGANQPVRNLMTGRVEITSQNHGFAVDEDSIRSVGCEPTHLHLNDGTLAGFRHLQKPMFAVQFHPEASPGPHDSSYLFDVFIRLMQTRKPVTKTEMNIV